MSAFFHVIPRIGGLAYLNMPKSACTSILLALSRMHSDPGVTPPSSDCDDGSHPVHGFQPPSSHLSYFFGRWPGDFPPLPTSLIRFTFVRNPYARFLSFYRSKIALGQEPGDFYRRLGIERGCPFDECVARITATDPADLEHHALPQSMILCDGGELRADFVGKIENFAQDWPVIQALSGFDVAMSKSNVTKRSQGPLYTETLRRAIYEYYRDDFELFGYAADSTELATSTAPASLPIYTRHHGSKTELAGLKQALESSTAEVVRLAAEFERDPEKRQAFFRHQGECFRELQQKRSFHSEQRIEQLLAENAGLRQSQRELERTTTALSDQMATLMPVADAWRAKNERYSRLWGKLSNRVRRVFPFPSRAQRP